MTQTNVESQCGARPTWQVGGHYFQLELRMYFEMDVNGNALSSSTSGTVISVRNSINQSYSVRIEHYQPSGSCSNHYECAVVFNSIQSGAGDNRIPMNVTGESYILGPRVSLRMRRTVNHVLAEQ